MGEILNRYFSDQYRTKNLIPLGCGERVVRPLMFNVTSFNQDNRDTMKYKNNEIRENEIVNNRIDAHIKYVRQLWTNKTREKHLSLSIRWGSWSLKR